jgi:hypothetical protein
MLSSAKTTGFSECLANTAPDNKDNQLKYSGRLLNPHKINLRQIKIDEFCDTTMLTRKIW